MMVEWRDAGRKVWMPLIYIQRGLLWFMLSYRSQSQLVSLHDGSTRYLQTLHKAHGALPHPETWFSRRTWTSFTSSIVIDRVL